jgi:hypothetical protein
MLPVHGSSVLSRWKSYTHVLVSQICNKKRTLV